jgi:peptide/nickel transport system permease protein
MGCIAYVRRYEHLRQVWRKVFFHPAGLVSTLIIIAYLVVGLMDSLHFYFPIKGFSGPHSALDYFLRHLAYDTEKSFSSPFSCVGFTKEPFIQEGQWVYDYPPLTYACQTLMGSSRFWDIIHSTVGAFAKATLWLVILWHLRPHRAKMTMFSKKPELPQKTFWITLGIFIFLTYWSLDLSHHYHIFGTDKVGQDIFYNNLKSIRTGLIMGLVTLIFMLPFAICLGLAAGYFRGWVDDIIQYIYTTLSSVPAVLLISASVLTMQAYFSLHSAQFSNLLERADARLLFLCLILGVTGWSGLCRLLRAEALKIRNMDYILAARVLGASNGRILFSHLLPNVMHIILISAVLDFSGLVLSEAVLSYVGVGVDSSTHSWGNMINSARLEMARVPVVWWALVSSFFFMFTLVLSANILADTIRDAFDPEYRPYAS